MSRNVHLQSDPNHRELHLFCEEISGFLGFIGHGRYFNVSLSKRVIFTTARYVESRTMNLLVITWDGVPGKAPSRISQILTPSIGLEPPRVRLTGLTAQEFANWLRVHDRTPDQLSRIMAELRAAIESTLPVLHSE
jgi:hypothetical protein